MGSYPGRVMSGLRELLAEHGKLPYRQLAIMLYGADFTDADRASMARAIRQLVAKGELISYYNAGSKIDGQAVEPGMWARRSDVEHIPAPRFFDVPPDDGSDQPNIFEMSRADLLALDPSYGEREDCADCGMPYGQCFLLGDNKLNAPDHSMIRRWGDGSPVEQIYGEGPYWCCSRCFHDRVAARLPNLGRRSATV